MKHGNTAWLSKKRNAAAISIAILWVLSTAAIHVMYETTDRAVLWSEVSRDCAALLFYCYFVPYMWAKVKQTKAIHTIWNYLFASVFAIMLIYILVLLGRGLLDVILGPVTQVVTIADRWDPSRGGDKVVTTDGRTYTVYSDDIKLEKGRTYSVKIYRLDTAKPSQESQVSSRSEKTIRQAYFSSASFFNSIQQKQIKY